MRYCIWRWNERYLKIGLQTHQKRTETKGKNSWKNLIWSRDGAEKSVETRRGLESLRNPTHTTERCRPPLWPPTQCTCIPSLLRCVCNKWTRDASTLRWRPERGPASFRSVFLRLSNPRLVSILFQLHPYSKWSFSETFSSLLSLLRSRPKNNRTN